MNLKSIILICSLIFLNVNSFTAMPTKATIKSVVTTGWVKLHPSTSQSHNAYSVNKKIGTFGAFEAKNVKVGDLATDQVIPDGEYYVTFWVDGKTRSGREVKDVEHKQKMKFVNGQMQGNIALTVDLGKITSAGVSYPA